jgi:hypothetical protein
MQNAAGCVGTGRAETVTNQRSCMSFGCLVKKKKEIRASSAFISDSVMREKGSIYSQNIWY